MSGFPRVSLWPFQRAGEISAFSPITSTLIHGESEVVLVDTPISIDQTEQLISWIEDVAPNKSLKYIFITHGHGDHWFGLPLLQERWPEARAIATPATVAHSEMQLKPEKFNDAWLNRFPGQIYEPHSLPKSGHLTHIHLVVAGDVVYGDVHQFFGEANTSIKRREWLDALAKMESLNPHIMVAGHKRAGTVDGVFNIQTTREYILAFEDAVKMTNSPAELYDKMKALFPTRINPHAIIAGATAAFGQNAAAFSKTS